MEKKRSLRRITEKLYGGVHFSWLGIILYAVCAAVLTTVFLVAPIFQNTSFVRMGETLEAWIFFAVIIMANCKTPFESAWKTFVFFLISQPLIYLFQVPFSWQGWGLFQYYRYWLVITILTFPAAFIGWYITRRNWLSVLILAPILAYLGIVACNSAVQCVRHFPRLIFTALFCLLQIALYIMAFFPDFRKKIVGVAVPILAAAVLAFATQEVDVNTAVYLPNSKVLTESAVVQESDSSIHIAIERTGEDSMVRVQASSFGGTEFTIQDGEAVYRYAVDVYEDDGGHTQIRITEVS